MMYSLPVKINYTTELLFFAKYFQHFWIQQCQKEFFLAMKIIFLFIHTKKLQRILLILLNNLSCHLELLVCQLQVIEVFSKADGGTYLVILGFVSIWWNPCACESVQPSGKALGWYSGKQDLSSICFGSPFS